jgi:hypothetical protein
MNTIETTAYIGEDRKLVVQLPAEVEPGEHHIVVVITDVPATGPQRQPLQLPVAHPDNWPDNLPLRREDMYGDWGR